jgi:DNA repair photolyase
VISFVTSPLPEDMIVEKFEAKSLIRQRKNSMDIGLNPYQGCYHDCAYCDGKAENYNMHPEFGKRIRVKINAPAMLEDYLKQKGFVPVNRERTGTLLDFVSASQKKDAAKGKKFCISISGGVCDIYQPAETDLQLSRKLLQVVLDFGFPVFLLTKNKLVLRDLDLLKKINENAGASVALTVTLMDDEQRKIFEPRASSTEERFEALEKLRKVGIRTGIWAMPLLPWIGDSEKNVAGIFKRAKDVDIQYMCCSGLTLKPGRQKEGFFKVIKKHYPELVEKYAMLYANNNKYGMPDFSMCARLGVNDVRIMARQLHKKYKIEESYS